MKWPTIALSCFVAIAVTIAWTHPSLQELSAAELIHGVLGVLLVLTLFAGIALGLCLWLGVAGVLSVIGIVILSCAALFFMSGSSIQSIRRERAIQKEEEIRKELFEQKIRRDIAEKQILKISEEIQAREGR